MKLETKKKKESVVIFGAGGHGKVVLDILLNAGHTVVGFLDEDVSKIGSEVCGYKVLGDWSYFTETSTISIALGIGNNEVREKVYKKAKQFGCPIFTAIHPKSTISQFASIGEGVVVMPGAVINPGVTILDGVVINTGATVDHDCILEKFCHIWPGAHLAGTVRIGAYSYIGTGSAVIQNLTIGKQVVVGAGAAVVCDIADNVTVVGVPAKVLKIRKR